MLKRIRKDVKWAHQRIWKGYCDYDLYSIYDWFLEIMPCMLEEYKTNRHGSSVSKNTQLLPMTDEERDLAIHAEWDKTLDRMIFMLREMDEHENPYTDEYMKMMLKYREGPTEHADGSVSYHYNDITDSKDAELSKKYHDEIKRIDAYRNDCKKIFFDEFSEHFYDLWD